MTWPCPTKYAEDVVRGKAPAGKPVLAACRRHLRDMEADRYNWRPDLYQRVFEFLSAFHVFDVTEGRQVPFNVLPWQAFVVGSLFGWTVRPGDKYGRLPGTRRFRRAFLSTAKSTGKSPLLAGLGLYMVTADGWDSGGRWSREHKPAGYIMASTSDQSKAVGMETVWGMVDTAHDVTEQFQLRKLSSGTSAGGGMVVSDATGGTLTAVSTSSQGRGKHGLIVSWVHAEEVHEWADDAQLRTLDMGTKGRAQPLVFLATNAAQDRTGFCWQQREAACAAADGETADGLDGLFGFVAEVDDEDVPEPGDKRWWPVEKKWSKANPSFGPTVRKDYYWEQLDRAKAPFERVEALRLLFGHSPGVGGIFVTWPQWRACEGVVERPPPGGKVSVGIDLGPVSDLTAVAFLWHLDGGRYSAEVEYWTPADTLRARDHESTGHLEAWAEAGLIRAVPGNVLNYEGVVEAISERIEGYEAVGAMDPYDGQRLRDAAHRAGKDVDLGEKEASWEGFPVYQHPQGSAPAKETGLWMDRSIDVLAALVIDERLTVPEHAVLRWNLQCVDMAVDQKGNRRFVKFRGGLGGTATLARSGNIDGLVALAMAAGLADVRESDALEPPKQWAWEEKSFAGSWF